MAIPMTELTSILLFTTGAGLALPVGGLIARFEHIRPAWLEQEFRHSVLAFGGGILLAAVSLVLVPEGIRELDTLTIAASFIGGGVLALLADRRLARSGLPASNLLAALLDFAPEAIALGALMASNPSLGALLAGFIALQNLPEGFNAYREMVAAGGLGRARGLTLLAGAALLGPVCGLLGYWLLADAPQATGITMLLAAGGILYLVFQDIAPQAKLSRHWGPPLGAVLGFALGLVAELVQRG
jgi:zinc transporter, ZIP family